ncbi:MAG: YHS domain-containing protein [Deltaproteobacteria bacterium]|nr:YHS domain-containing protein [Deltaproteobacteria bacterium]MCL4873313.1 YHS domain-containing protein [bacterium]
MPADPVCKMELSEEDAEATAEYKGMTYYFCSEACKEAFEHAPERFVKKTA